MLRGAFNKAIFSLDIGDGAEWDFGAVTWRNIQIVVNTTSTDETWCKGSMNEYMPSISSFQCPPVN
jgi:hypothetical protein